MNDLKTSERDIVIGRATVPAASCNGRVGWALVGGRFTESERYATAQAVEMNRIMSLPWVK